MATADIIARLRLNGEDFSRDFRARMSDVESRAREVGRALGGAFTGAGTQIKSASDSFAAFERGQQAADRMVASISPLFAAQLRYNQAMDAANDLQAQGVLTGQRYIQVIDALNDEFRKSIALQDTLNVTRGRGGMVAVQASQQVQDFFIQVGGGQSIMLAATQQLSQLSYVMSAAGGGASRFATIMSGPWGAAIMGGTVLLGMLLPKLLQTDDAVEEATRNLADQARQAEATRQAQEAYGRTLPGVIERIREQTEALEAQNRTLEENQQRTLATVRGNLDSARIRRREAEDQLREAREELNVLRGAAPEAVELGAARSSALERRIAELEDQIRTLRASERSGEQDVRRAETVILDQRVTERVDEEAAAAGRLRRALDELGDARARNGMAEDEYMRRREALIRQNEREVEQIRQRREAERRGRDGDMTQFRLPVQGRVRGQFGEDRGNHRHAGVDLAVPVGTNVAAAAAGTVVTVGELPGYGRVVIVDHGRGTTTRYAHLSQVMVARGQRVGQGDVIALSGGARGAPGAGNSRGPHLHFEVRRSGRPVAWAQGRFPTDEMGGNQAAEAVARTTDREAEARGRILRTMAETTEQSVEQNRLGAMRAQGLDRQAQIEERLAEKRREHQDRLRELGEHGASRKDLAAQDRMTAGLDDQLRLFQQQSDILDGMLRQHGDAAKLTDEQREAQAQAAVAAQQALERAEAMAVTSRDHLVVQEALIAAESRRTLAVEKGNQAEEHRLELSNALLQKREQEIDQMKQDLLRGEENAVRDLADLYFDLFDGNTDDIWHRFKDAGLEAIAMIAAQWTLAMMTGQRFDIGNSITQLGASGNPVGMLLGALGGGGRAAAGGGGLGLGGIGSLVGGVGGAGGLLGGAGGALGAIGSAVPYIGAALAVFSMLDGLGAFKSTKRGSATLGFSGGELGAGSTRGNSRDFMAASSSAMDSVGSSLQRIAEMLGGSVTGAGSVSLGQRDGKWRGDPSGRGITKTKKGAVDFGEDQEAAIRWAISEALRDGVIGGISDAARRILQSGKDLEKAIEKAAMIEEIPKLMKARLDPVGAELDKLNERWAKTIDALKDGAATTEQMAQAQQVYKLELEEVMSRTASASAALKDFLESLKIGPNSPYSLRDQESMARAALDPYLAKIAAGEAIDQDRYQQVAQTYLDIERQLYGSTGSFFEAMDTVMAATSKAIERIDSAAPIRTAVDPFVEKTAGNTTTMTEQLGVLQGQIGTLIDAVQGLSGSGSSGGFIGGGAGFSGIQAA